MQTGYWIESEAGDGINGLAFETAELAKAAVVEVYGDNGTWLMVPGAPDSPENAWEYDSDHESVETAARIEARTK